MIFIEMHLKRKTEILEVDQSQKIEVFKDIVTVSNRYSKHTYQTKDVKYISFSGIDE